jgi:tRNA wybutosine-synthesizing protein 2
MAASRTVRGPRRPPAERVRERVRHAAGAAVADELPCGYQRMGGVLVLRLPPRLAPHYAVIGRAWQEELGVATVLVRTGPIAGELREPTVRCIAGDRTETEVVEHGVRWRFDAARVMFAAGNRTERMRIGRLVRPGERVVDLFAGIGYFAIPAARAHPSVRVIAVEKNPVAYRYLVGNIARNAVADRVDPRLGENREVSLPEAAADRVFLGYLPDATPWIGRALGLLRPEGGWLHVHTVADARGARERAAESVARAVASAGGTVRAPAAAREVKAYGPGRTHVVVDVRAAARGT